MRAGFTDTDAYLAEWRASDWEERDGELEPLADELAAELEASYPPERVRAIMANGGFES